MADEAEQLWVYVTEYPDGSVGMVSAFLSIPPVPPAHTPCMSRRRDIAEMMFGEIARNHAVKTGQRVWLREYARVADYEL